MDARKLVKAYIKIREERAKQKAEFDKIDNALKEKLAKIESALLQISKDTGVDSLKTEFGTASKVKRVRIWAPDKDAFMQFVKEHDAFDLLEGRIHQGNIKQFMEDHPDVKPPVDVDAKYVIQVRKATK